MEKLLLSPAYLWTYVCHIGAGHKLAQKAIQLGALNIAVACKISKVEAVEAVE